MTTEISALGPFLTNRFGDRYLYEVNRNTFNQVGSEAVFRKHFGKALAHKNRLYVIVGTDSGLLPNFLVKTGLAAGSRYLFVELPAVLKTLERRDCFAGLPEQMTVTTPDRVGLWLEKFQMLNYVYLDAVVVRGSLSVADANLVEYNELLDTLRDSISKEIFSIKGNLGARTFMIRQIENMADNRISGYFLKNLFPGKTAVVLGGGPSLDEFLPWVKENQHNLAIFAVSRVSRQVLDAGVQPDFVVSIDPQEISFSVSRDMFVLADSTVLIHSYHVVPSILAQWPGRSIYLGDRCPWKSPLNEPNLEACGPTVTNTAISVAVDMGFSQIVLLGVDLCFSASGITHARGSKESQLGPHLSSRISVVTNSGDTADTNAGYFSAIASLSEQAANVRSNGCRIVTPAGSAAQIEHVDFLPVKQIDIAPLGASVLEKVLAVMPSDDEKTRAAYFALLRAELTRVKHALESIRELAAEALVRNRKMFQVASDGLDSRHKRRMDEIERQINNSFPDIVHLIKRFALLSFLKATRPDGSREWSRKEVEKIAHTYYEAYRTGTEELLSLVNVLLSRLTNRVEEDAPSPNLTTLISQWRQEKHPGRVLVWKKRRGDALIGATVEELEQTRSLEEEFRRMLSEQEAIHGERITKRFNPKAILARGKELFRSGDKRGLRQHLERLLQYQQKDEAQLLASLMRGYLNEMMGNIEVALENYHALIGDEFNPLTEAALKQIASIALSAGNQDLAISALECLSHGAPVYKSQLGSLLQIVGRHQEAADTYVDYLEAVPGDLEVMIKLGQLYRTMGHENEARQVFQLVLQQDPMNQAAQTLLKEAV